MAVILLFIYDDLEDLVHLTLHLIDSFLEWLIFFHEFMLCDFHEFHVWHLQLSFHRLLLLLNVLLGFICILLSEMMISINCWSGVLILDSTYTTAADAAVQLIF